MSEKTNTYRIRYYKDFEIGCPPDGEWTYDACDASTAWHEHLASFDTTSFSNRRDYTFFPDQMIATSVRYGGIYIIKNIHENSHLIPKGIFTPVEPTKTTTELTFADKVDNLAVKISQMLIDKNDKYGNSALEPVRTFSSASPVEQILVRIDDKLSRIKTAHAHEDEDVLLDLIGYLYLLIIAKGGGLNTEEME